VYPLELFESVFSVHIGLSIEALQVWQLMSSVVLILAIVW
jgi:hypothetical protein